MATGSEQQTASCRVCLEESSTEGLCQPCSCAGTMSHAHPGCIQHWINEKGDMRCEICKQTYTGGFRPPPPPSQQEQQAAPSPRAPLFRGFLISADPETGTVAARRGAHEDMQDADQEGANAPWWLTAVLVFMLLLLLRHVTDALAEPNRQAGDPNDMVTSPEFSGTGITFSWGTVNVSGVETPAWQVDKTSQGTNPPGDNEGFWLLLRFMLIVIPCVATWCLVRAYKEAEEREFLADLDARLRRPWERLYRFGGSGASAEEGSHDHVELAVVSVAPAASESDESESPEPPSEVSLDLEQTERGSVASEEECDSESHDRSELLSESRRVA